MRTYLIDRSIPLLNRWGNMSVRGLEPSAGSVLVQRGCGRRRAAALAALRSSLAGLGTYVLLSSLPRSAAAADVDIHAVYEVTFAGLAVANANLSVAVRGSVYTARINYRTLWSCRAAEWRERGSCVDGSVQERAVYTSDFRSRPQRSPARAEGCARHDWRRSQSDDSRSAGRPEVGSSAD